MVHNRRLQRWITEFDRVSNTSTRVRSLEELLSQIDTLLSYIETQRISPREEFKVNVDRYLQILNERRDEVLALKKKICDHLAEKSLLS